MQPDLVGKTISHYKVISLLGRGAWGTVYKAKDTRLQREVALKFLGGATLSEDEHGIRFLREARAAAALQHPSICTVHEVDEADGHTFIAMAHVEGRTLRELLADGPLPLARALNIVDQIADGLADAHAHGIVHRDIKPANVMVTEHDHVQIMDFGLAKLANSTGLTRDGVLAGTPAYMSPEQARGEPAEPRCDIWALGALFYELLAGRPAFTGGRVEAVLYKICHEDPPALGGFRPDLPPALLRVIGRALSRDPAQRYQDLAAFRADLTSILGSLPSDVSATLVIRRPPILGRAFRVAAPLLLILSLSAVLLMAIGPELADWFRGRLDRGDLLGRQHVAVLSFADLSEDPTGRSLCDGLVEYLTSKLTTLEEKGGSLRMIPAAELRRAGVNSSEEARKNFGATVAVTGSLLRDQDSLQLTVNLVDTHTLRQIDSAVLETALADAASLQTSVLERVAGMLGMSSPARAEEVITPSRTISSGAYIHYLLGRGELIRFDDLQRLEAAIQSFERALDEDPDYALAEAALGEALWRLYRHDRDRVHVAPALEHCLRALELDARLPEAHLTMGMIHRDTGQPELAVTDFLRAQELAPIDARVYAELGRAYTDLERFNEALATYEHGIALRPHDWLMHRNRGRFHWRRGELELAEESFRNVVEVTPDNFHGFSDLGGILLQAGKTEEARAAFERSLAIQPNLPALANLGTLAYREDDFETATKHYRAALAISDTNHRLWGNLGGALMRLSGWEAEAEEAMHRAIGLGEAQLLLEPRNASLLTVLSNYHATVADSVIALEYLERAVAIEPDNPQILFSAGHGYELIGRREQAFEFLRRAVTRGCPTDRIVSAPTLRYLRQDPRYAEFLVSLTKNDR